MNGQRCELCNKVVGLEDAVWMALDTRTNTYTIKPIPAEFDQGGFPFHKNCSNLAAHRHRKARTPEVVP